MVVEPGSRGVLREYRVVLTVRELTALRGYMENTSTHSKIHSHNGSMKDGIEMILLEALASYC